MHTLDETPERTHNMLEKLSLLVGLGIPYCATCGKPEHLCSDYGPVTWTQMDVYIKHKKISFLRSTQCKCPPCLK